MTRIEIVRLDDARLQLELDSLVAAATRESPPRDTDEGSIAHQSRALLNQLRSAPGEELSALHAAPETARWSVMRLAGEGEEEIICLCEGADITTTALITGKFNGEALIESSVQVGERFWDVRQTPQGESLFSSENGFESEIAEQFWDEVKQQGKDALKQWMDELSSGNSNISCAGCGWVNVKEAVLCDLCKTLLRRGANALEGQEPAAPSFADEAIKLPKVSKSAKEFLHGLLEEAWDEMLDSALDSVKDEMFSGDGRECVKCRHIINEKARFCENCGADQEAEQISARKNRKPTTVDAAKKARVKKSATEKPVSPRRKSQKPKDLPE